MNQELTNRIRTILLLAAQANKNIIKPKNIMDKFNCDISTALDYADIFTLNGWAKGEYLDIRNENQGSLTLTSSGLQKAEDVRNEDRWNKVLNICDGIDNYSLPVVFEILNRCIVFEIQREVNKQYTAQ